MQQALGWLHWPPDAFWNATLHELHEAVAGYVEIERAKAGGKSRSPELTAEETEELLELGRKAVRDERRLARQNERKQQ